MPLARLNSETTPINSVDIAYQVFEEHGDFIRRVIRFHLGNKPEAEDVFQDLFVFLALKPLPGNIHNIESFLYKVVTARIIDKFRHESRIKALIGRYAQKKTSFSEVFEKDFMAETEKMDRMFNLVERNLPRNEALAVMLRYKYNYDIRETAKKMGVKPRSVSRYLSVAISKLRGVVKDNYEGAL